MEYLLKSEEDTKKFAKGLAAKIKPGDVLALYGDLGAGKTTFTRYLVEALDIKSRVQSPTFVIERKYKGADLSVNHIDLYRLTTTEEVKDIGLQELIEDEDSIVVLEWPEIAESLLPKDTKMIEFEYVETGVRKAKCTNF